MGFFAQHTAAIVATIGVGQAHRGRSHVIAWLCRLSGVGGRHHLSHRCRTPGIWYSISINTNHCMRRGIQAR